MRPSSWTTKSFDALGHVRPEVRADLAIVAEPLIEDTTTGVPGQAEVTHLVRVAGEGADLAAGHDAAAGVDGQSIGSRRSIRRIPSLCRPSPLKVGSKEPLLR